MEREDKYNREEEWQLFQREILPNSVKEMNLPNCRFWTEGENCRDTEEQSLETAPGFVFLMLEI
jgi:hypothetical protein